MRAGGWWPGSTPKTSAACWRAWPRPRRAGRWIRCGDARCGGPGGAAPAGGRRAAVPAGVRQRHRPGAAAAVPARGRSCAGDHHQQPAVGRRIWVPGCRWRCSPSRRRWRSWPSGPAGRCCGARILAAELGCLPLALAQAAAVIASQHLSYATYVDRLRRLPVARAAGPGGSGAVPAGGGGGGAAVAGCCPGR